MEKCAVQQFKHIFKHMCFFIFVKSKSSHVFAEVLVKFLALQEKNKYTGSFYRLNIFFPVIQPICILTLTTIHVCSLQIRILRKSVLWIRIRIWILIRIILVTWIRIRIRMK
jgi:hypothetical protein